MLLSRSVFSLGLLAIAAAACGGSSADPPAESDDLTKGALIPQVVQYEGKFDDAAGAYGTVQLLRDGTYRHFDPHLGVSTGKLTGPKTPVLGGAPIPIKLDALSATISESWSPSAHAILTLTLATGSTVKLVSEYALAGETACDGTGGQWTDDDADPKTGLFCLCKSPSVFTHAGGGCSSAPPAAACRAFPKCSPGEHVDSVTCACVANEPIAMCRAFPKCPGGQHVDEKTCGCVPN